MLTGVDAHSASLDGPPGDSFWAHVLPPTTSAPARPRSTPTPRSPAHGPGSCCPRASIYLDGNSLGALPAAVPDAVADVVATAVGRAADPVVERGRLVGRPRAGRRRHRARWSVPGRVRSWSPTPPRSTCSRCSSRPRGCGPGAASCVTDRGSFPTDLYVLASVAAPARPRGGRAWSPAEALAALAEHADRLALVASRPGRLPHRRAVGPRRDHRRRPRRRRADVLGPVPLRRGRAGRARRARGRLRRRLRLQVPQRRPGRTRLRLRRLRHQAAFDQPLTGWKGHGAPFAMSPDYVAAAGHHRGPGWAPLPCCRCSRWRPRSRLRRPRHRGRARRSRCR